MKGKLFQKYLPRLLDVCFPRGKFTSTPSNTASNTGSDASGDPGTLFKNLPQQNPHCLDGDRRTGKAIEGLEQTRC
ncbi:hypothetical protein [Stutzerimonas nitrititolerans]|uniref:hypothetical protein n=1 Tax=Stutzerimonas nitrititolerans TaxID=2482751 RepID=UPI002898B6ED|nr:hypothetical protein [Stutzerimonas nitrititolerans]